MGFRDANELHYWDADDEIVGRLRIRFPRWRVWRGRNDQCEPSGWYATRTDVISEDDLDRGLCRTLDADNDTELARLLGEQERIQQDIAPRDGAAETATAGG
ncbi:hypothetical protein [Sphaerisporangium fuscum]|uniref:hypothetical protein n=1 Tax=Sphaerisporangium fuscum TaxID=2835868 RepID=UPI001BDC5B13|nr:hypothetical protein [Sphaerisporangium fuscum]